MRQQDFAAAYSPRSAGVGLLARGGQREVVRRPKAVPPGTNWVRLVWNDLGTPPETVESVLLARGEPSIEAVTEQPVVLQDAEQGVGRAADVGDCVVFVGARVEFGVCASCGGQHLSCVLNVEVPSDPDRDSHTVGEWLVAYHVVSVAHAPTLRSGATAARCDQGAL